jgi:hypothetical protein
MIPRNRLNWLAARMLTPNPNHCLHHQHPDLATWKTKSLLKPSKCGVPLGHRSPR